MTIQNGSKSWTVSIADSDFIGQETALLDVTAPRGIDDCSTIGHGLDRLNGLLFDAVGRRIDVNPWVEAGSRVTGTITLDPAPATSEFNV